MATDLQGLGVGTRLVEQLAEAAAQEGIETFVADVMAENDAMLQVFADTGYDVERTFESGEIQVRLRIAASDRFLDAVDRRDHTAVDRSLEPFFRPQTVAVIGASARPGRDRRGRVPQHRRRRVHRPGVPGQPLRASPSPGWRRCAASRS